MKHCQTCVHLKFCEYLLPTKMKTNLLDCLWKPSKYKEIVLSSARDAHSDRDDIILASIRGALEELRALIGWVEAIDTDIQNLKRTILVGEKEKPNEDPEVEISNA